MKTCTHKAQIRTFSRSDPLMSMPVPNNDVSYQPCFAVVMKPFILRINSTVGLYPVCCKLLKNWLPPPRFRWSGPLASKLATRSRRFSTSCWMRTRFDWEITHTRMPRVMILNTYQPAQPLFCCVVQDESSRMLHRVGVSSSGGNMITIQRFNNCPWIYGRQEDDPRKLGIVVKVQSNVI